MPDVHLVTEPSDDSSSAAFFHSASAPELGCVIVEAIRSGSNLDAQLYRQVAVGLGKSFHGANSRSGGRRLRQQVIAWLYGERTRYLVITRAQNLTLGQWRAAINLAEASRTQLWFVVQGRQLTRGQQQLMADHAAVAHDLDHLRQVLASYGTSTLPMSLPEPFPAVPQTEFVTFRDDCARLLDGDAMRRVEEVITQVDAVFDRQRTSGELPRWLQPEHAIAFLRSLLNTDTGVEESTVILRAAQEALLSVGWYLKADLARYRAMRSPYPPTYSDEAPRLIRTMLNTSHAAAAAIRVATALDPLEIRHLALRNITEDGLKVTCDGLRATRDLAIPPNLAGIVRAHRFTRVREKAPEDWPFFVAQTSDRREQALTDRGLQRWFDIIRRQTGLYLGPVGLEALTE